MPVFGRSLCEYAPEEPSTLLVDVEALYKWAKLSGVCFCSKIYMLYSPVTFFFCPRSDNCHKELEQLIESELHCLVATFVTSAILSADYFCLVSYISSDGHFSVVYLYCLVTALLKELVRCAVL